MLMLRKLLPVHFLLSIVVGQPVFTEHVISTSANGATSVHAEDVDGDGDLDVLSASANDNKIAWYENHGSQDFTRHTITTSAAYANIVYAADVDGDGDLDVLSASKNDDTIAWYENDGSESFTEHAISTSADGAFSVYAVDVDGDGDMDVLSASAGDDKIAWYENDGSESFTEHAITTSADYANTVYAADVDGDGDMDVLSASNYDDKIAWYENNGSESFTEHVISTSANGAFSVHAVDVDADGDMDVLSASENDDKIAWYENDGSESFTEHVISTSADGARSVYATDVDGDGDMDVLSASGADDKIAWYENDGSESFTEHVISTSADGARSVYAADIDGDGDLDMLSALSVGNKITWYENFDSQEVAFVPDDKFEQALIDLDYDDTLDDYVLTENISEVTSLDVSEKEISDLTGIEEFTALEFLYCENNQLNSLDLSNNSALLELNVAHSQLESLDVSNSTSLELLDCYGNNLTSLDVSSNTALINLNCPENQLTALDVSNNTSLITLNCSENQLTYLNMKNGITDALVTFDAKDNALSCIETLDPGYATAYWSYFNGNIDFGVVFAVVCEYNSPVITNVLMDPVSPAAEEDANITAEISDETGIDDVTLYYRQGGSSGYTPIAMSGSVGSYTGTIPGSAVTMNGLLYYIVAHDVIASSTTSDTLSTEVRFNDGSLTTNSTSSSAYPNGLPMGKWRLVSIPAVLDDSGVLQVIEDELGPEDNEVWRLFEYMEETISFNDNPAQFTPGDSYWLYQRVGYNLSLSAPAGETGDMSGTTLTIRPGWNLIGSPYSFSLPLVLDPEQFYGPIAYGLAAEEWSGVVSELEPWNGYAVYNRSSSENITLDPTATSGGGLARTLDEEEGWLMTLQVRGDEYQDRFNTIGALSGAHDQLDWHDNPEIRAPERFVSLFFRIPDEEQDHLFTSDIRALDGDLKIWDTRIRSTAMESAMTLSWHREQSMPDRLSVQLLDLNTRTLVDMVLRDHLVLGHLDSRYDRQLKIIAGDPAAVALAVNDILSQVPEELSIQGNYPNPFNPVTTIRFGLPEPRNVRITVVNILGQEITELVNGWKDMGRHEVIWQGVDRSGKPVASGIYFTVLSDRNKIIVQKMLLLK